MWKYGNLISYTFDQRYQVLWSCRGLNAIFMVQDTSSNSQLYWAQSDSFLCTVGQLWEFRNSVFHRFRAWVLCYQVHQFRPYSIRLEIKRCFRNQAKNCHFSLERVLFPAFVFYSADRSQSQKNHGLRPDHNTSMHRVFDVKMRKKANQWTWPEIVEVSIEGNACTSDCP